MALTSSQTLILAIACFALLTGTTHAFGAGNIGSTSSVEGQNWRHGDIEDTLLTILMSRAAGGKKFSKLDVKRVYFGNWLRDYSQAVDVGTVKYVSAEAIRIILWVLGFMSFGYGTKEFEVTTARLGCYRPEDHIDNPKDYADNEDARQYDRRLRGPVDERKELAINAETGLKNYISTENAGYMSSAEHVRVLFRHCIELGRKYARNHNEADLHEALRLLGTGCHCLEDFSAHSNYTELALIEMGERDIFPHVGRRTQMQVRGARGPVFPVVTGTFGGVDFLHSVMGEFDDKATQSEIQDLEGTLQNSQGGDISLLEELFDKVPSGLLGGEDQAGKAQELKANATAHQMQNSRITPRQPEEWTRYLMDVQKQIYPILEWHDEIVKSITETIEKIPILPDLIEQLQDQINVFVFSLIAPFVVPIINQVKAELNTGSSEIIQSSLDKQHIVFSDDHCSDPTHSMLSKDHFSNVLNEPAGKIAAQVLKWVVPQIIAAWDDERIDIKRTNDRIIHGVFHHPALREQGQDGAAEGRRLMFGVVEKWWREKDTREQDSLRRQLSREGVESGRNHKPGVVDHGHGCGKPLGMPTFGTAQTLGAGGEALSVLSQIAGGGNTSSSGGYNGNGISQMAGEAVGGGILGGIVGGLAGDLLGGGFNDENKQSYSRQGYGEDGSYQQTVTQYGGQGGHYEQTRYTRTDEPSGARREEYQRFEQGSNGTGYGVQKVTETRPTTYGVGYDQTTEVHRTERTDDGGFRQETQRYGSRDSGSGSEDEYGRKKHHEKKHHKQRSRDDDGTEDFGRGGGYNRREDEPSSGGFGYGRPEREEGYGQRQEYGGGQEESFGRQDGYGQDRLGYQAGFQQQQQSREYGQESSGFEGRFQPQRQSREYGQEQSGYGSGGFGEQQEIPGGFGEERSGGGGGFFGGEEQEKRRDDGYRREDNDRGYSSQGYEEGGESDERY